MKRLLILCALLSGCADMKYLENRLACSANKDTAYVVSWWAIAGIATKLASTDSAVVCK